MTTVEPWPVGVVTLVAAVGVVVLAALLIVLVPVPTGGLGARPKPARDYAEAMARFEAPAVERLARHYLALCRNLARADLSQDWRGLPLAEAPELAMVAGFATGESRPVPGIRLVHELEKALQNMVVRADAATSVERDASDWVVNGTRADAVVFATPAYVTAALLRDVAPSAAQQLAAIEYAGVALVSMAFARDAIGVPLDASGFLVPKPEGLALTACSWSSTKWAHLDDGPLAIIRASTGHYRNEHALDLDDDALVTLGDPHQHLANRGPARPTPSRSARVAPLGCGGLHPCLGRGGIQFSRHHYTFGSERR